MKRVTTIIRSAMVALILTVSSLTAQSLLLDLEKAKSIKLLEADRNDVLTVFREGSAFFDNDFFSREATTIRISYSSGKCTSEEAYGVDPNDWNVREGKVIEVSVRPKDKLSIDQIGLDVSKLKKERIYRG